VAKAAWKERDASTRVLTVKEETLESEGIRKGAKIEKEKRGLVIRNRKKHTFKERVLMH